MHHGAALRAATHDENLARAVVTNWRTAGLGEVDRALCELAERLTRAPADLDAADIARLRELGLSQRAIHDACQVIAYFNYVNRIALGLGIELEDRWKEGLAAEP